MSAIRWITFVSALVSLAQAVESTTCHDIPSQRYEHISTGPFNNTWPWRSYKSSPHTPAQLKITSNGKALSDGYLFMGANVFDGTGYMKESAAYILRQDGDLVYAGPKAGTMNFQTQTYRGRPVLTYWNGTTANGTCDTRYFGRIVMLDDEYELVTVVDPKIHIYKTFGEGFADTGVLDVRESTITPQNSMLLMAYNNTPYDLTPVNGPADGWITDQLFYEVDIATQEILFSWSALDHVKGVPITKSKLPFSSIPIDGNGTEATPWDYFHANGVNKIGENYLFNARHIWETYLISGTDGRILWTFNGETGGDFGPLAESEWFQWQHHAVAHNVTNGSMDLSFLNNYDHELLTPVRGSRAMVFHLEYPEGGNFTHRQRRNLITPSSQLYSPGQGSYTADLPNNNQLVSYGMVPVIREYGPAADGSDLRWEATFGVRGAIWSYRVYKSKWHATPKSWDPSLVVEDGKAYVSWNGATDVTHWTVYAGTSLARLRKVGCARKRGFETLFPVPAHATVVRVAAVQDGQEVRKSNVVSM